MSEKQKRLGAGRRLRNYFLTGLIIVAPLAITAYLTWTFIGWVDGWVKPYIPAAYNPETYLPFAVPGFGLLTALVPDHHDRVSHRQPGRPLDHLLRGIACWTGCRLVRSLYKGLKQIFQTVLAEQSGSFKQAALIEYPRRWTVVDRFHRHRYQG
jgi:uncharacterized membrane protein